MFKNLRRFFLRQLRKMRFLPPKFYAKVHYEYFSGKKLDLYNPIGFNAKLEWYKVFFRPKILNTLVDKFEVRDYIEKTIGKEYLNDIYGVYNSAEEIPFSELPNQFVIKATHSSGHNVIVRDKNILDIKKTSKKLNKWLKVNQYYRMGQEWAYKDVKPRYVVEKFLEEEGHTSLLDYKFYCFDGEPKFVDIHLERELNHKQSCFDMNFNKLPFTKGKKSVEIELDKPSNFDEMISLSKILSKGFPFVRVDFYSVNGKTIFGELTFYPGDARKFFYPYEYNKIIGDYFKIPKLNNKKDIITSLEEVKY